MEEAGTRRGGGAAWKRRGHTEEAGLRRGGGVAWRRRGHGGAPSVSHSSNKATCPLLSGPPGLLARTRAVLSVS